MTAARMVLIGLVCVGLGACTVMDVRDDSRHVGVRSDGMVDGFATVGWAEDPSFFRVEVLDGRSDGALALVDLWYLARVEVGAAGASVGVGPFDAGIGTLFYDPVSPAVPSAWADENDDWCEHDDDAPAGVEGNDEGDG